MSNINEVEQLFKRAVLEHSSEEELEAYHDNAVDEIDRARIEAHLDRCLICERRLAMIYEATEAYPQELITEEDTGRVKAFLLHDAVASLEAIGRLDSAAVTTEIIPHLASLLQDESNHVRQKAAEALGKIAATDEILPLLPRLLADEHSDVRKAAVAAVEKLGTVATTDEILSQLHRLQEDEDGDVREAVVKTIGKLAPAPTDSVVRRVAVETGKVPLQALEALREFLQDFSEWVQQHGIPAALVGASSAPVRSQPQDGQTEDGALRWRVVEDEWGDLVVRFGSHRMELEGVKFVLKAGPIPKEVVLEAVTDDQVGAEVIFTREERTEMPEDIQLTVDILNDN